MAYVISNDKPIVWLHGEIKTPPLSEAGRLEAGYLLRRLQRGERLEMPPLAADALNRTSMP